MSDKADYPVMLPVAAQEERARLHRILTEDKWFLGRCPVCGAHVELAMQERHTNWHLRCLQ